ncbi:MAG TPA: arginine--tRNA ligase [Acidimicrobiales bacterium]|nr:arginine--tRNA ligase [Acidimicrobiales bacterium]
MIRDVLEQSLRDALTAAGVDAPASIQLERPARREHGDWSTNVALATAKPAGRNPRELATELAGWLSAHPADHVDRVELAGPGFVNFHLEPTWLHDVLRGIVEEGVDGYAAPQIGGGRRVNVEFVSANPTGPLHAGGGRWAAYGDALANLLERTGHDVHREYYLNDRGTQMRLFGASLASVKAGEPLPEDGYRGEYIEEWASEMPAGVDPTTWGYERVKRDLSNTLLRMNVRFDTWFSEQTLVDSGAIEATLAELRERGMAYDRDGAVWIRTEQFGDRKDQVIVRSDDEPAYLLGDLAYHRNKFERGFGLLIDVWGADHHAHVASLKGALQALGHDPGELEIVLGQLVTLMRDGQPVRLSKRAGDLVLLADLLDAVGPDAARLTFLLQSLDTRQTIDLGVITAQTMDNPVFYVQMAHARIAGIARRADEVGLARHPLSTVDFAPLVHERELDLLRSLDELPEIVAIAVRERAPHKVTTWVRELADRFHGFYHDCYVIGEGVTPETTQARLWLVEAARIGLAIGLDLLGVSAPESM